MFVNADPRALSRNILIMFFSLSYGVSVLAYEPIQTDDLSCQSKRQFTFSWSFREACKMMPRGGTSRGAKVMLDPEPHPGWLVLQATNISEYERDRRAILAMAGPYRTSFDFLEVVGYSHDFEPDQPYQSWGTEYVYVVEDTPGFISLQHIMVMYFENEDGEVSEPMVMKHWRQDWRYQPKALQEYKGGNVWENRQLKRKARKGEWSQSVYQVDDSPRYAALGRWQHTGEFSSWRSDTTWRPLPRRESSVREDYHVLEGFNRHTIVPTGWVHEEENYKVAFSQSGDNNIGDKKYLAKELGLNRYERIVGHDFSPGDAYWKRTGDFWRDVRNAWETLRNQHASLSIEKVVDGVPLFMPLFEYAETLQSSDYRSDRGKIFIRGVIEKYSKPVGR